jgi:uncharacterized protein
VLYEPIVEEFAFEHGTDHLVGDLVRPPWPGPHPVVVFVEGSGPGGRAQGTWPARLAAGGLAVLAYDKPGSGASTGDWTTQSLHDRADETLAAVDAARAHPDLQPDAVALLGGSQGGWVAQLAPSLGGPIAAVVTIAGPGVGMLAQEEYRLAHELPLEGFDERDVADAVGLLRERARMADAGLEASAVHEAEAQWHHAPWYARMAGNEPAEIGFVLRNLAYDPIPALAALPCPLLAIFGADDFAVPVEESVRVITETLATVGHTDHRIVVFPHADHNARLATGERAPGFNELIVGWLGRRLPATSQPGLGSASAPGPRLSM